MTAFKQLQISTVTYREAKQRAKLAFVAYEKAFLNGDAEIAQAARARFLNASKEMAQFRRRAHNGG